MSDELQAATIGLEDRRGGIELCIYKGWPNKALDTDSLAIELVETFENAAIVGRQLPVRLGSTALELAGSQFAFKP
jgi:hypothetical protein